MAAKRVESTPKGLFIPKGSYVEFKQSVLAANPNSLFLTNYSIMRSKIAMKATKVMVNFSYNSFSQFCIIKGQAFLKKPINEMPKFDWSGYTILSFNSAKIMEEIEHDIIRELMEVSDDLPPPYKEDVEGDAPTEK